MKTAIIYRRAAVGDVLFVEPCVRAMGQDGYKVHVETMHPTLFDNHPYFIEKADSYDHSIDLNGVYEKVHRTGVSIVDCNLKECGYTLSEDEKVPRFYLTEEEKEAARNKVGFEYVVISPSYAEDSKGWNKGWVWERVIDALHERGYKVVLIGRHDSIAPSINNADLNLQNKTTLREAIALIACASHFIGIGHGMMNVAQATNTPGVAVFRQECPFLALMPNSGIIPIHFYKTDGVRFRNAEQRHVDKIIEFFDYWDNLKKMAAGQVIRDTQKSAAFSEDISNLVYNCGVQRILETGAYDGLGSTLTLARTGLPVDTIECNASHVRGCRLNLASYPKVTVHHGLSMTRKRCEEFLKTDDFYERGKALGLLLDVEPEAAYKFYMEEIDSSCEEGVLSKLLNTPLCQLVHLDSAGGLGYAEFLEVTKFSNKIVVFDDVDHVKHYRSMKWCMANGLNFNLSKCKRWGWVYMA